MRSISELPEFAKEMVINIRDVLFETATNIKIRMSESGSPITYPVQWDSEKQRRAFFATDGFGNGIPYHRTGDYERGWGVERKPLGVSLFNDHPAGAVGGLFSGWQSRIHRGRWNNLLRVLVDELGKIPDAIRNKFTTTSGK